MPEIDVEDVGRLLAEARRRLAGAPREALGERRDPRRILGIRRAPRIVRVGSAWHLGVLLLTDDALLATGEIVRARTEAIRGFTAESQRARAALAGAAARGGFPDGETVHIGWQEIDLSQPATWAPALTVRDGQPAVRWSPAGDPVPLARYVAERVALLEHPPERA